jgi:hypothetical protein
MSDNKQATISGAEDRKISGNSILLRMNPVLTESLRIISKREERTLTTIMSRAFKDYIKANHPDIKTDIA